MKKAIDYNIWSQDDLTTYFHQSYIGIKNEEGHIDPVFVANISRDAGNGDLTIVGRIGRNDIVCALNSPKMCVPVPCSRFVNVHGQTVYCSRKTSRQYKKGIKKDQYLIATMSRHDACNKYGESTLPMVNFDKDIIDGMFNRSYPTFAKAVEDIQGGLALSVAFCDHFAVAAKVNIPNLVLLYKGNICGQIIGDRVELADGFTDLQEKLIELMG